MFCPRPAGYDDESHSPYAVTEVFRNWKPCLSSDGLCLARDGTAWQSGRERSVASADWLELTASFLITKSSTCGQGLAGNLQSNAPVSSSGHCFSSPATSYHTPICSNISHNSSQYPLRTKMHSGPSDKRVGRRARPCLCPWPLQAPESPSFS